MKHRPLMPVTPRKRMDSHTRAVNKRLAILHRAARRAYSKRYYQKNKAQIQRWAHKKAQRMAHGDHRLTRYQRI
jgi:hypothetical protein